MFPDDSRSLEYTVLQNSTHFPDRLQSGSKHQLDELNKKKMIMVVAMHKNKQKNIKRLTMGPALNKTALDSCSVRG